MSVTRAMTKQIRIQQWTEVFKGKAVSGLKVKEYCQMIIMKKKNRSKPHG